MELNNSWGMFTSLGNLKLKKAAEKFLERLEKAPDHLSKMVAAKKYFIEYQKLTYNPIFREAGDTAVRGVVWGFALDALPQHEATLDKLWNEACYETYKLRQEKINAAKNVG